MLRLVFVVLSMIGLFAAPPAFAAVETTAHLTFNSKATMVDSFATALGRFPGGPLGPAFITYGGPDITPGTTVVGGVSTEDYYIDAYFFLGVTDGPGSADGMRHLVMGVNQSLAGQSFEALFPKYSESALIDAIVGLNAGTVPNFGKDFALVSGFQSQYADQYAFNLHDTGYLTAFSTGQDFGTIKTSQTVETIPGGVPEPITWVMMIVGVGMIGLMSRRSTSHRRGARLPA